MLSDEKIKNRIKQFQMEDESEGVYIYGVVMASLKRQIVSGPLATLSNRYYVMNVTNKRIQLHELNWKAELESCQIIELKHLSDVLVKNWMLGLGKKFHFIFDDGSYLKINAQKKAFGVKKQRESIKTLEERFTKR